MPLVDVRYNSDLVGLPALLALRELLPLVVSHALHVPANPAAHLTEKDIEVRFSPF